MSGGFEDLGLLPELVKATQDMGWALPSAVQDETIPLLLGGGDVMVAAETGSGKTGAFALPAIQLVHETRRAAAMAPADSSSSSGDDLPAGSAAKRPRLEKESVQLNANDRSPMTAIAPEGLTCQCRQERDWGGVRATRGVLGGSAYYEARINDEGLCRFGWSSQAGSLDLGTDAHGYGYGGTGKKSNAKSFVEYGGAFGRGDVIGCMLQMAPVAGGAGTAAAAGGASGASSATISFTKNGTPLGVAFTVPRVVGALFPAICMKNGECSVNFGATAFTHAPPAGFVGIEQLDERCTVRGPGGAAAAAAGAASGGSGTGGGKKGGAGAAAGGVVPVVGPICLILEPARDLAEQTSKAIEQMRKYVTSPSVSQALFIGGVDAREINRQFAAGAPDIVTGTPMKTLDLIESGKLNLSQVRLFILDEADKFTTDEESLKTVLKIYAKIRSAIDISPGTPGRLQTCFFSATLHSPEIGKLAESLHVKNPTWVDLKGKDSVPDTVHHVIIPVDPAADLSWAARSTPMGCATVGTGAAAAASAGAASASAVSGTMEFVTDGVHERDRIRPAPVGGAPSAEEASEGVKRLKQRMLLSLIDSLRMEQCLIFCRTNLDCDNLEKFLTAAGGGQKFRAGMEKGKENPYSCAVLAGARTMEERRRNLEAFKSGDLRFLISTDIAARGIDVKELPYVVNMTQPDNAEDYIHRIGRVGRADHMGLAISLVATCKEKVWYHKCSNRGKGCANTRLADAGGCCIWYDEPALIKAVYKRLQVDAIPAMEVTRDAKGPTGVVQPYLFKLPPGFEDVAYGEERGATSGPSLHVEEIRDQVTTLVALEARAQSAFLALKLRYPGAAAAGGAAAAASGAAAGAASGRKAR